MASPPRKRKRYNSKFQTEWIKEYDFLTKSDKGECYTFCTVCSIHFSVAHGGRNDVDRHRETEGHKRCAKLDSQSCVN